MQHDTRYLFLSMTISGVACFLFFRFAYPYHLLHREQMLLFTYTVDQFIDYFNHPAPLSCLGGDFLTQFFHNINMLFYNRMGFLSPHPCSNGRTCFRPYPGYPRQNRFAHRSLKLAYS